MGIENQVSYLRILIRSHKNSKKLFEDLSTKDKGDVVNDKLQHVFFTAVSIFVRSKYRDHEALLTLSCQQRIRG